MLALRGGYAANAGVKQQGRTLRPEGSEASDGDEPRRWQNQAAPPAGGAACALLTLVAFAATPATAQDRVVDLDPFYEQLEPYGQWFEHPVWGTVWRPRVDQDWRPYARGMWVYTDEFGWYWEAEEPWGWAAFHYGRWLIAEDGAWIWLPDNEWGPAWVAWRASDEFVGWAPLPPDAHWGADGELLFDAAFYSAPRYHSVWCFVRPHQLILTGLHRYLVSPRHADAVFRSSRPFRAHHKLDGRFVNAGFDVRRFERMTGRPVVRLRIKTVDSPQAASLGRGRAHGGEISVYKPQLCRATPRDAPAFTVRRPSDAERSGGPERAPGRDIGRESPERGGPDRPKPALADQTPEPNRAPALARPGGPSSSGGGPSSGGPSSPGPAASVDANPPAARPPASSRRAHARPASVLAMAPIAVGSRCLRPPQGRQPATAEGRRPASISAPDRGPAPSTQRGSPHSSHTVRRGPPPRRDRRRVLSAPTTAGPTSLRAPPPAQGAGRAGTRARPAAPRAAAQRGQQQGTGIGYLTGGAAAGGGTAHIAAAGRGPLSGGVCRPGPKPPKPPPPPTLPPSLRACAAATAAPPRAS